MRFLEKPLLTWREPREFVELCRIMAGRPVQPRYWFVSAAFPLLTGSVLVSLLAMRYVLTGQLVFTLEMVSLAFILGAVGTALMQWGRYRRRPHVSVYPSAVTRVTHRGVQRIDMSLIYGWDTARVETANGELDVLALEHKTHGLLFFGLPEDLEAGRLEAVFDRFGMKRQQYRLNRRSFWFPEGARPGEDEEAPEREGGAR